MTDWGAVKDRTKGIAAGQDLEMPGGSGRGTNSILSAIKASTLSEEALNTLIDFHVLTEEQLNGILSQINQA